MAPNEFGAVAVFMALPFLFFIAGLIYIAVATGDRSKRRDTSVRVLPVGAKHPLSHVRAKMRPEPQANAKPEQKKSPRRRSEPPWLTRV